MPNREHSQAIFKRTAEKIVKGLVQKVGIFEEELLFGLHLLKRGKVIHPIL